jgi:hypothetical protein
MSALVLIRGEVDRHAESARDAQERLRANAAPGPSPQGHLTLTTRGRAVVITLAAVCGIVLGFVGGRADAASVPVPVETVAVVVERGDTLWSFAERVAQPGDDLRDVVRAIQSLNGMDSAGLVAGELIQLPAT